MTVWLIYLLYIFGGLSMKHKTVENMVRTQFNIDDDIDVRVEFLFYADGFYEFEVEWFNVGIRYQSNFKLPQISYMTQDMLEAV
jgi:hypothetical protein